MVFGRSNRTEVPAMSIPTVYIMASRRNGTLYTGVTSDLARRAYEHREGLTSGFTKQHGCRLLVWYEGHETMPHAIAREKQIKGGSRQAKIGLIETINPQLHDLYETLG
jgi:predicted GIY-YIG superfamily endonuclease